MRAATTRPIRFPRRLPGSRRLVALAASVAALASLAAAPAASASHSETTLFDLGTQTLNLSPAGQASELNQLQAFGVDTVRLIIQWRDFAPDPSSSTKPTFDATDPAAYPQASWDSLDQFIRGATARGLDVLLTPSGPVPNWASTSGSSVANPIASDYGQFVQALGTRYSGSYTPPPSPTDPAPTTLPGVSHWSVWNEPNLPIFLQPQLRRGKSVAATIYRGLFLAAQQGLQASGHAGDQVLMGETSPGPGRGGTDPIAFVRGVFCLNRKYKRQGKCAPINAAGWAQHPYDPFDPPFRVSHNLINLHSIGLLATALNKARAAGATRTRLPIYITEYGVESFPDHVFGVSPQQQAEYLGISEYLTYRNPRIRSYGQYLMDDDPGNAQLNFQTGLRYADGTEKIAYSEFPIALAAQRRSRKQHSVTIWGHVRPKGGPFTVTVNDQGPGGARALKTITTNSSGYFQFNTPFRAGRRYSASTVLPDGTQLTGPFEGVYVFP